MNERGKIESVDVLKGATASALYGARGGAGAVMITTKKGKEEGLKSPGRPERWDWKRTKVL